MRGQKRHENLGSVMKAFIAAVVVSIGFGLGAAYILDANWQKTASQAYATGGARVGDPGNNLVGSNWYDSRS
jgi:hypothetical protein